MRKCGKIALAVSLGLNVLLIGFLAGGAMRWFSPEAFMKRHGQEMLAILPPERAAIVRPLLKQIETEKHEMTLKFQAAKDDIAMILGARDFDEAALRARMAAISTHREDFLTKVAEILVQSARGLDFERRQKLAAHIRTLPSAPASPQ